MQLKQLSFAGVIALSSIQAACVEDADPGDLGAADQAETTSGSSGSGGTCTNPVPGHPMYWNQSAGVACDTNCIGSGYAVNSITWRLVASRYTVRNTCSLGKHTGVGLTESTRSTSYWTTSGPVLHSSTTPWTKPTLVPEVQVFNHGRTVDPSAYQTAGTVTLDYAGGKSAAIYEAVGACVGLALTDGFCDRMCGNDAYTIPPAALYDGEQALDSQWLLSAQQPFSNRATYGNRHLVKGRWFTDAGLVVCDEEGVDPHQVYPRYGHNSNTDANAQRTMFGYCNTIKSELQSTCNVTDENIGILLRKYVMTTCENVCGGNRRVFWTHDAHLAKDQLVGNKALPDSSLTAAPSSAGTSGPQPQAGSLADGPWGYVVKGM